jgi:hypothetical protein
LPRGRDSAQASRVEWGLTGRGNCDYDHGVGTGRRASIDVRFPTDEGARVPFPDEELALLDADGRVSTADSRLHKSRGRHAPINCDCA